MFSRKNSWSYTLVARKDWKVPFVPFVMHHPVMVIVRWLYYMHLNGFLNDRLPTSNCARILFSVMILISSILLLTTFITHKPLIFTSNHIDVVISYKALEYWSGNHRNLLTHFFDKNFVKTTFLNTKELISRNIFWGEKKFLVCPNCGQNLYFFVKTNGKRRILNIDSFKLIFPSN